jgi:glycosyltransferase involved in cell wall biosynthesis
MNLLYIIAGETGFKTNDEKIFRTFADVKKVNYMKRWDYFNPKIINQLIWSDIIIIWFASKHAIPVIIFNYFFKKPLYIIAGGWDVANVPEINYGAMRGGIRGIIGKWILSKATKVIAVSNSNRNEIISNTSLPSNKIELIYNSVSLPTIQNSDKKNQVLTVGELNAETYLRKGIDHFIEVAKLLPNISFIHIGKWTNENGVRDVSFAKNIIENAPDNIEFLGFVPKKELEYYFSQSKVYLQLSRHEAFGVSVVEAMSYGCKPIVSSEFALPEIVSEFGLIIENMDYDLIANKIESLFMDKLLQSNHTNKVESFLERYSFSQRESAFKSLLSY